MESEALIERLAKWWVDCGGVQSRPTAMLKDADPEAFNALNALPVSQGNGLMNAAVAMALRERNVAAAFESAWMEVARP